MDQEVQKKKHKIKKQVTIEEKSILHKEKRRKLKLQKSQSIQKFICDDDDDSSDEITYKQPRRKSQGFRRKSSGNLTTEKEQPKNLKIVKSYEYLNEQDKTQEFHADMRKTKKRKIESISNHSKLVENGNKNRLFLNQNSLENFSPIQIKNVDNNNPLLKRVEVETQKQYGGQLMQLKKCNSESLSSETEKNQIKQGISQAFYQEQGNIKQNVYERSSTQENIDEADESDKFDKTKIFHKDMRKRKRKSQQFIASQFQQNSQIVDSPMIKGPKIKSPAIIRTKGRKYTIPKNQEQLVSQLQQQEEENQQENDRNQFQDGMIQIKPNRFLKQTNIELKDYLEKQQETNPRKQLQVQITNTKRYITFSNQKIPIKQMLIETIESNETTLQAQKKKRKLQSQNQKREQIQKQPENYNIPLEEQTSPLTEQTSPLTPKTQIFLYNKFQDSIIENIPNKLTLQLINKSPRKISLRTEMEESKSATQSESEGLLSSTSGFGESSDQFSRPMEISSQSQFQNSQKNNVDKRKRTINKLSKWRKGLTKFKKVDKVKLKNKLDYELIQGDFYAEKIDLKINDYNLKKHLKRIGDNITICGQRYQILQDQKLKCEKRRKVRFKQVSNNQQYQYFIKLPDESKKNFKEELQMREIHCEILTDFENIMGQLTDYQNCLYNQENIEMYQKIFAFELRQEDHIDLKRSILKKPFIIYVVQERLKSLKDVLKQMKGMNMTNQRKFINKLILQLTIQISQISDDISCFLGMSLDNIFIRQTKSKGSDFKFVFSFQHLSICPRDCHHEEQVQDYSIAHTCSAFVIQQIITEIKKNLKLSITKKQKQFKQKIEAKKFSLQNKQAKKDNQILNYIDEGAHATVYDVRYKGKLKAVKQFNKDDFEDISEYYKEAQIGLMFAKQQKEYMPLIPFEDIYLDYDPMAMKPFTLNIIMPKAEQDVFDIIHKAKKRQLAFNVFFPIFRDCILGLVYMHNHCLAHCDIKPCNVLQINPNSYTITDYGEGENLNFQCKYLKGINFSKGTWTLKGTPSYFSPTLFRHYDRNKNKNEKLFARCVKGDLYKFDIYSMGITLLEVATSTRQKQLNSHEEYLFDAYKQLFNTTFPLCIKQTILHMIAWRQEDRIPTVSLFYALKDIQRKLQQGVNIWSIFPKIRSQKEKYEEIYGSYKHEYNFIDKLQQVSLLDQSFYTGHLKIVLRNSEDDNIFLNDIVIMKPEFIPKKVIDNTALNQYVVIHLGKRKTVQKSNLYKVQLMQYKEAEIVNYFTGFQKTENKNWREYQVQKVDNFEKYYTIIHENKDEEKQDLIMLPFDTLMLKPHPKDFFFKDFFLHYDDLNAYYNQEKNCEEQEEYFDSEIIPEAIFKIDFEKISKENLADLDQEIKVNLTEKNYSKFYFFNGGERGDKNLNQYQKFIQYIPYSMYVQNIFLNNCNLDSWINIGKKFPQLHDLEIIKSFYYQKETFRNLLLLLRKLKYLNSFKLCDFYQYGDKIEVNIVKPIFDIIMHCPIKTLTLLEWQNQNKQTQNIEYFYQLWKILKIRNFSDLKIQMTLTENKPTKENIFKLKKVIEAFFNTQQDIHTLWLEVNLAKTDFGLELFQCIPDFFMKHTFTDLIIQITGIVYHQSLFILQLLIIKTSKTQEGKL